MSQGQTEWIAFLDECGDHSLVKIDGDFPLFVLSLVLLRRKDYLCQALPAMNSLKLRYWDHEGVNLHSRDIRKAQGPMAILQHPRRREAFMSELTDLIRNTPFVLFVVGIRKDKLSYQYVHAQNPYDLALEFVMERLVQWMEQQGQDGIPLLAESRGRNEDNELKAAFFDLISRGTRFVTAERFQKCRITLDFHDKRKNIGGIQLADLCAHPAAREMLKPGQANRAFAAVQQHLHRVRGSAYGWKVFP